VATYLDVPGAKSPSGYSYTPRYTTLGYDPDPVVVAQVPRDLVTNDVAAKSMFETDRTVQPNLWFDRFASHDNEESFGSLSGSLYPYFYIYANPSRNKFFTSSMASDVDTGVLRYHALRHNSSLQCWPIEPTDFPATCSGSRPFVGDTTLPANGTDLVRIRWCVPGAYDVMPWTLSRDRQDITEEMFLDVALPWSATLVESEFFGNSLARNFTMRCTSSTTRGYFELPSNYNQHQPGPLLEKWPALDELAGNFNDKDSHGQPMRES
jgi:hypothetical protein